MNNWALTCNCVKRKEITRTLLHHKQIATDSKVLRSMGWPFVTICQSQCKYQSSHGGGGKAKRALTMHSLTVQQSTGSAVTYCDCGTRYSWLRLLYTSLHHYYS